jgi:tetratricopeptide (TPR) repeat protein
LHISLSQFSTLYPLSQSRLQYVGGAARKVLQKRSAPFLTLWFLLEIEGDDKISCLRGAARRLSCRRICIEGRESDRYIRRGALWGFVHLLVRSWWGFRMGKSLGPAAWIVLGIAATLILALVIIGIAWSIAASRRATNNRKSALGLMIALIGWIIGAAVLLCANRAGDSARSGSLILTSIALSATVLIVVITSTWLAARGLHEIASDPHRYKRGLMQSVFSIVLAVALTNVLAISVMTFLGSGDRDRTIVAQNTSLPSRVALPAIPRQTEPAKSPDEKLQGAHDLVTPPPTTSPMAGSPLPSANAARDVFDDYNFTFDKPAVPWAVWTAKVNNDAPTFCQYMRIWPSVFFLIVAEKLGDDSVITEDVLVSTSMSLARRAMPDATLVEQRPYSVNGITGRRLLVHGTTHGEAASFVRWLVWHNGYAYQLVTFGGRADERMIQTEADKMFERFRLIDPSRAVHAAGDGPLARAPRTGATAEFHSKAYGYSVNPGARWMSWADVETVVPSAEYGALLGSSTCIAITPMALQGVDADTETLAAAMCMRLAIPFNRTGDRRPSEDGRLQSFTCSFDREMEGKHWDYRFKVLRKGSVALLIVGWGNDRNNVAEMERAIAAIRFEDRPAWPILSSMPQHERLRHAILYNETGLELLARHQTAKSVPWFEQATELMPDDPTIFDNLITSYIESDQMRVARLRLNRAMQRFRDNPKLRARAAYIEAELGDADLAIKLFAEAFAKGYRDEPTFHYYARLLIRQQRWEEALAAAEAFGKNSESIDVHLLHAMALGHKGERQRAVQILQGLRRRDPNNVDVAAELGVQYVELDQFDEAQAIASQLIDAGRATPEIYLLLAQAEIGRKQLRSAKGALESALAKNPNHKPSRDLLGYVSAMLGEGENSSIQQPIDPVALPPALATLPVAPADFGKEQGAYYVQRVAAISFVSGVEQRQTDYRTVRILDTRGADMFGTLHFEFDPLLESIYVNKVEVTDAQGKVISTVKPTDCYVTDAPGDPGMSRDKTLNVPISGLAPGTIARIMVTRKEQRAPTEMRFVRHLLSSIVPVARSSIYLKGDVARVRSKSVNAPPPQPVAGDTNALCWTIDSPEVYHYEAQQAEISEYLPTVLLCDKSSTWQGEAKDYLDQLAPLLSADAETTALAKRLTQGLADQRSKVAALLKHVQSDYTYKAIEFGRRARIPQKPADIIRNRYGDCKDHALLLRQMLEAIGIRAHLALARAYDRVEPEVPTLDQFDHMVVYAPALNLSANGAGAPAPAVFDCTDKDNDLRDGIAFHLVGKQILVLDSANIRLETVPPAPSDVDAIDCARKLEVSDGGDLLVHETVTFRGAPGGHVRGMLRNLDAAKRNRAIEQTLASIGIDASVGELHIEHLTDADQPLVIETEYRFRNRFNKAGGMWVGRLAAAWERYWLLPDRLDQRHSPVHAPFPLKIETRATLVAPAGMSLREPPAAAKSPFTPYGTWQVAGQRTADGGLSLQAAVQTLELRVAASSYADYYRQRESLIGQLEPTIVLEPRKK